MSDSEQEIDWSKTTFDGSRHEQLRRWRALTVRQRLEALDAMTELAERMAAHRLQSQKDVHEESPAYAIGGRTVARQIRSDTE